MGSIELPTKIDLDSNQFPDGTTTKEVLECISEELINNSKKAKDNLRAQNLSSRARNELEKPPEKMTIKDLFKFLFNEEEPNEDFISLLENNGKLSIVQIIKNRFFIGNLNVVA